MFFILSKTLYFLLMPIVWIIAILLFAIFTKHEKRRKKSLIAALALLLFFSNDFIINEALLFWEKEPVPIASLPNYETGIVLTGITHYQKASDDRVYFNKGADRLLHTVQLYQLGKIKKILITGGSGLLESNHTVSEADRLKSVFLYCGITPQDIIIENKSRNTYENAVFSKQTIDSLNIKGNFLLITSAFHMRRAKDCFKKSGLTIDIFPVDFNSRDREFTPDKLFIPSENALTKWSILIHEVIGYVVYKLVGYC